MTVQSSTTSLDPNVFRETLGFLCELGLVSSSEANEVMALFAPEFPLAGAVAAAESIHLHVKVDDVSALPHDRIVSTGVRPTSCTEGYVKYPFSGGINAIFSSIPIREDDMLAGETSPMPVLDHKGIDLRTEADAVRAVFDAVPGVAAGRGWRHVPQGEQGRPVYCCHTEVEQKHWVYPEVDEAGQSRPIEVAYGELKIHEAKMGCDLRPIDPAHPRADEARLALSACAASHGADGPDGAAGTSYYERADLGHFTDVGQYARPQMQKFWAYYNSVFAEGALTRREKALIGLAVAHSQRCPYCIDSFTNSSLDAGATVDQMHEAVHVAASLGAGICLVHGVQMQNALKLRDAI